MAMKRIKLVMQRVVPTGLVVMGVIAVTSRFSGQLFGQSFSKKTVALTDPVDPDAERRPARLLATSSDMARKAGDESLESDQLAKTLFRDCGSVLAALAADPMVGNVDCFVSGDLTTANPLTTPSDNSLPGLPPGAFTPRSDAANTPGNGPESRYPITMQVPGLQVSGTMADDTGARWVIRLPDAWNGRLLVGVAAGFSSEYGQDIVLSNYLVQHGYAYAGTNKGALNRRDTSADDPKGCTTSPGASTYIHSYLTDLPPDQGVPGFLERALQLTAIAKNLTRVQYGHAPQYTYAGGTSIGAFTTRSLVERHPDVFDGGIGWAPPYVTARGRPDGTDDSVNHANFISLLSQFPIGLKNFPGYRASGYSPVSDGYLAIEGSHYFPPDIFGAPNPPSSPIGSFHETMYNGGWQGAECALVRALDPTYQTPPGALPTVFADYNYAERFYVAGLRRIVQAVGTTGNLRRPLIELHGTFDDTAALRGTRLYAVDVINKRRAACHRVYEVEHGSHRDKFREPPTLLTQIEPIGLKYLAAFERLVTWVERGHPAPPSQCIPVGGTIVTDPASIGRPTICPDGGPPVSVNEDGDRDDDVNGEDDDFGDRCIDDDHDDSKDFGSRDERQREQPVGRQ
jgi:hypothetical protein